MAFNLYTPFPPAGDQPDAIRQLDRRNNQWREIPDPAGSNGEAVKHLLLPM